jgi:hypothetical protein
LIAVIQEFCIAFYGHQIVVSVVEELEDTSWNGIMKMTWIAGAICWACTFGIPLISYLCHPVKPSGMVFHALNIDAPEVICGNIIVVIVGFLSDAFFTFIIAKELADFIVPGSSRFRFIITSTALIVSLLSIGLNKIPGIIGRCIGEIFYQGFVALAYILPPVYYFGIMGLRLRWGGISVFVLGVGLFVMGSSLWVFAEDLMAME